MSYETEILKANVKTQYLLVLTLGVCSRRYGVSPCVGGIQHSGTAAAGAARSITLDGGASATDDIYNNMTVRITGGTGAGQENKIIDYVGGTKVAPVEDTWAVTPDGTSVFDIIDRPNACFNTRFTCQDPANYLASTKDFKFSLQDRALPFIGETIRSYIQNTPEQAAGQIDPRKAIIQNTSMAFQMADEPDNDVGFDLYLASRLYDPESQGTFWTKFTKRNPFYNGRPAVLKLGVAGMAEVDYQEFKMVIETIDIANRQVTLTVKDQLKLLDKAMLPKPMDAVSVGAITSGASTFAVDDGTKFLDPVATVRQQFFAVDKIVIRYQGISGNNLTGCLWGRFGTTPANVADGAKLQQCWGFENVNGASITYNALIDAGFVDADINTAGLEEERDRWLIDALFTGVEVKPKKVKKIVEELMFDTMSSVFMDHFTQKVQFKVTAPPAPGDPVSSLTDADFKSELPELDKNEESRLSDVIMWYNRRNPFDTGDKKWENFANGFEKLDADAESSDQYGEPAIEQRFSTWVATDLWATRVVQRYVSRFRDRAEIMSFTASLKDSLIKPGAIIKVTTKKVVDFFGAAIVDRFWQVLSRGQKSEAGFDYELMDTNWAPGGVSGGRYAFISPAGWPVWTAATDAEKEYAFIGNASNRLGPELTIGYYFF